MTILPNAYRPAPRQLPGPKLPEDWNFTDWALI